MNVEKKIVFWDVFPFQFQIWLSLICGDFILPFWDFDEKQRDRTIGNHLPKESLVPKEAIIRISICLF